MSVLEVVFALAIVGSVALGTAQLFKHTTHYFRRITLRNQITTDLSTCMQSITQFLPRAKSTTVVISTPNTIPLVPNSQINFVFTSPLHNGTTAYTFLLSNQTVQSLAYVTGQPPVKTQLASNVQSLIFGYADTADPYHILITLRLLGYADPNTPISQSVTNQVVTLAN